MKKLIFTASAISILYSTISLAAIPSHPYQIKFYNNTNQTLEVSGGIGIGKDIIQNDNCTGSNLLANGICFSETPSRIQIKPHQYESITVSSNYTYDPSGSEPYQLSGSLGFNLTNVNESATNKVTVGINIMPGTVIANSYSTTTGALTTETFNSGEKPSSKYISSIIQTNPVNEDLIATTVVFSNNPLASKD